MAGRRWETRERAREDIGMIAPDAMPIKSVSPYRRIDPMHPGRKAVITRLDLAQSGDREPDPALYRYSPMADAWYLKDGA
jgi:hypothetical protein